MLGVVQLYTCVLAVGSACSVPRAVLVHASLLYDTGAMQAVWCSVQMLMPGAAARRGSGSSPRVFFYAWFSSRTPSSRMQLTLCVLVCGEEGAGCDDGLWCQLRWPTRAPQHALLCRQAAHMPKAGIGLQACVLPGHCLLLKGQQAVLPCFPAASFLLGVGHLGGQVGLALSRCEAL